MDVLAGAHHSNEFPFGQTFRQAVRVRCQITRHKRTKTLIAGEIVRDIDVGDRRPRAPRRQRALERIAGRRIAAGGVAFFEELRKRMASAAICEAIDDIDTPPDHSVILAREIEPAFGIGEISKPCCTGDGFSSSPAEQLPLVMTAIDNITANGSSRLPMAFLARKLSLGPVHCRVRARVAR